MRAGVEEEKAMALDRTKLLEAVGLVIAKEQLEEAARALFPRDETGSVTSDGGLEALRMKKLEAEEKRAEREERRAEREAEERRADREREAEDRRADREREAKERKAEREADERKREADERRAELERQFQMELKRMELEQAKLALEMKRIETQAVLTDSGDGRESENGDETNTRAGRVDNTLAGHTKRYGDIISDGQKLTKKLLTKSLTTFF